MVRGGHITTTDTGPRSTKRRGPTRAADVIISYIHSTDRELAEALQKALGTFGRQWNRPRALRVVRDTTDLSATPELWESIRTVLAECRYFVLMASPASASPKWVDKEVEFWLARASRATC